jgi:signal transduction histidine kinase
VVSALLKRSPIFLLTAGGLLLVAMVAGVVLFTVLSEQRTARQTQVFESGLRLNLLAATISDLETSQRGYLLTQDRRYLEPYQAVAASVLERIRTLGQVASDDAAQRADFDRLRTLIPQKLAEMQRTIDLANAGRLADAVAIVNDDSGRELMENIRATIERMRQRQLVWRAELADDVRYANTLLRLGVGGVAIAVLLFGGIAFAEKRRQRLAIERQSKELMASNTRLSEEIATREAAEEQVRQMQKMEAVGQLTGGIAHDFNNMLAVIISAIGLMRRRIAAGSHDIERYLDGAAEAAERAATLTRRLLAFSRQQPLAPEQIDANKMVSDMSELLRRTLGETVQLETVLAGGLWRIHADPSQLENSIINLAVNARDAMPEDGKITIETANVHLDDRYAAEHAVRAGQYVLVAVTDTGVGMSQEVVDKAFDPFFTTKGVGKGTGLGLSQVYGFVKQSDGHIKIYSEPGHGTIVKLYLPRHFPSAETAERDSAARSDTPAGARDGELILLVEDEERVRLLSADTLREIGYSVIAADSGRAAIQLLEENPGIVLLFTDIVMPEMSGRVLADTALKMRPELKVLYMTGFTRNAVVHNGVLDPGVNFIAKPFTMEELAAKLRAVLDQ